MRRHLTAAAATALLLASLTGCTGGGGTDDETTIPPSATAPASTAPGSAAPTTPGPSAPAPPSATPSPTPTEAPTMTPETPVPPPSASGTRLAVTIQESADAEPVEYILECVEGRPGPGTSLPNAEAACTVVSRLGVKFFTAIPDKNIVCTEIYGGPQTASITGTVDGKPVRARFARTNGCEISRWDAVKEILGTGGAF